MCLHKWATWVACLVVAFGCTSEMGSSESLGSAQSALCAGVKLAASPGNPVAGNVDLSLSATSATCAAGETAEYRFLYRIGGTSTYSELRGWSTDPVFAWPWAGRPSGKFDLLVRARAVGSTASQQSQSSKQVWLGDVCNQVTLAVTPPAPVSVGAPVTLTASATCTGGAAEYRFLGKAPGSSTYTELRGWGSGSMIWNTAAAAAGTHSLQVQTRAAGNASNFEASATQSYRLGETCGGIVLSTGPASPAPVNTVVAFSATASCSGAASGQFRFSYRSGTDPYVVFQNWGVGNGLWDTSGLGAGDYQLRVEVRADDYAGNAQATKVLSYVLGGLCKAATLAVTPASPRPLGTSLLLDAGATCSAAGEYQFKVRSPGATTYTLIRDWGPDTMTWDTTGALAGSNTLLVNVRAVGNSSAYQTQKTKAFLLGDVCTSLTASVSPPSGQPSGTLVTITGSAGCVFGGVGEYRFWQRKGTAPYALIRDWGSATANWDTSALDTGVYQIKAETRGQGHVGAAEASSVLSYALSFDPCEPNPCQHAGVCFENGPLHSCDCTAGFGGSSCEYPLLSAAEAHTCRLGPGGSVICWGDNVSGASAAPALDFKAIATGSVHNCGLRSDGALACWGDDSNGQASPPTGIFIAVAAGETHSCGIRENGSVACWGSNFTGESTPPSGDFSAIDASASHSCGIRTDGTLACWGEPPGGAVSPPVGSFTALSMGEGGHICAIRSDGTVSCWGSPIPGGTDSPSGLFATISVGEAHVCGTRPDGAITCWGFNETGQASPPAGVFDLVDAGALHTCGIKADGTTECWGSSSHGQAVVPSNPFVQLDMGQDHACALRSDGHASCWGINENGEASAPGGTFLQVAPSPAFYSCGLLPDHNVSCWGFPDPSSTPLPGPFNYIDAGYFYTCGLRPGGTIGCWGTGQAAPPSGNFLQLSIAPNYSCALRTDHTAVCWAASPVNAPLPPPGLFASISAGVGSPCGIRMDGTALCPRNDALGIDYTPPGVFTALAAGYVHACGLRPDYSVTCWGYNDVGQLDVPASQFTAVASEFSRSCGIRVDGAVQCWGEKPLFVR